jgi:outer membrane biosynthesis protein TonB
MQHNASSPLLFSVLLLAALLPPVGISACATGSSSQDAHDPHRHATRDYYPSRARRLGLTGRVGLEVSCEEGRYKNVVVIESAGPILDAGAEALMSDAYCRPGNPPGARSQFGVIFQLTNKPEVAPFKDNRKVVVVTARGM